MGDEGYEIGVGVSDTAAQEDSGYWGLTADSSDAEIWAALTRTMVSVDVRESESAYIYNSTSKGKKLGSVSGLSQGLNLIEDLDDGWSARGSLPQRGRRVRPRLYPHQNAAHRRAEQRCTASSIDKAAQTLTVYKNGERHRLLRGLHRPAHRRNPCTAKRPPASTSPSPAAARSRIPAATASTPFASAATITSAKSRPPRKTARIISLMADKLGAEGLARQHLPRARRIRRRRHQRRMDLGFDRQQTRRSRCSSSTTRIVLPSRPNSK